MKRLLAIWLVLISAPPAFHAVRQVSAQASAASLVFSPSSGTVALEQEFDVGVFLNTAGALVDGMDAKIIYEPGKLEAKEITTNANAFYDFPTQTINSTTGRITIQGTARAGAPYSTSGPVQVATISLKALTAGTTSLTFDFLQGATTDSNVAENATNLDILASVGNATFTVSSTTSASPLPSPGSDLPVGATLTPTFLLLGTATLLLAFGFWRLRQTQVG